MQSITTWIQDSGLLDPAVNSEMFFTQASKLLYLLNQLHPFREGNGRTQRVFMDDIARISGRSFDWSKLSAERNISLAARSAHGQSSGPMRTLLEQVLVRESD